MILPCTQAPVKEGFKRCVYCDGYGENPVNKQDTRQTISRNKCLVCDGAGIVKRN